MNFKLNVETINKDGFQFKPTTADVYVTPAYENENQQKVFDVQVDLTQEIEGGKIIQSRKHTLGAELLSSSNIEFDYGSLSPKINAEAVASIFQQFGLNITQ